MELLQAVTANGHGGHIGVTTGHPPWCFVAEQDLALIKKHCLNFLFRIVISEYSEYLNLNLPVNSKQGHFKMAALRLIIGKQLEKVDASYILLAKWES